MATSANPNTRSNNTENQKSTSSMPGSMPGSSTSNNSSNMSDSSGSKSEMNLHEAREKITHVAGDIKERATRMASDVSDRFGVSYDDAQYWMRQNYGKTLAVVGVLAAAGFIGYFLARRGTRDFDMRSSSPDSSGRGDLHRGFEQNRGFERV